MYKKTDTNEINTQEGTQKQPAQNSRGCLIALILAPIIFIVICSILLSQSLVKYNPHYTKFDDEKLAKVEKMLSCELPEDIKPVEFHAVSGAGDYDINFRAEDISDPEEYMAAAYGDVRYCKADIAEYKKADDYYRYDEDEMMIEKSELYYDNKLTTPDAIYFCDFERPETGRYLIACVLAFYKDGDTWKMKQNAVYAH